MVNGVSVVNVRTLEHMLPVDDLHEIFNVDNSSFWYTAVRRKQARYIQPVGAKGLIGERI